MAIHFLNADGSLKSIEYKGHVLKVTKGVSYQIMSDIWGSADEALVWDKTTKQPKGVYIRFCEYTWDSNSYAEVDATKAVQKAYREYLIKVEYSKRLNAEKARAYHIVKGCTVEVVAGRKVKKGTKGKVVVMIERENGWGYRRSVAIKLGIALSDVMVDTVAKNGKVYKNHRDMAWVWAYNCERTDAPEIDTEGLMKDAIESVDYQLNKNLKVAA